MYNVFIVYRCICHCGPIANLLLQIERVPINEQNQQPLTLPFVMDKNIFYNELWNVDPDGLTKMFVAGYVNAFPPMFPFLSLRGFLVFMGFFVGMDISYTITSSPTPCDKCFG